MTKNTDKSKGLWSLNPTEREARLERRKQYNAEEQGKAQHSPECKGVPHYYDGALGYEAMKCDVCGWEQDLNAEANAKATAERLATQAQHSPLSDRASGTFTGTSQTVTLKHTALPWHVAEYGIKEVKAKYLCIKHGNKTIARIDATGNSLSVTKQDEANARLIVASVNHADKLAEALREAWEIGADHRKPDFDTLNQWAALLSRINET